MRRTVTVALLSLSWTISSPDSAGAAPSVPFADGLQPVVSTLLGSSGDDDVAAAAVDPAGNAVIVGRTCGSDFPTQVDLRAAPGSCDVFVIRVARNGGRLLAATLIGGAGRDEAIDVAVDDLGAIYVAGTTYSPAFTGLPSPHGTPAGFVLALDPTASHVVWASLVGATGSGTIKALAVDAARHVWAIGIRSFDVPDVDPFQPRLSPAGPFVARLRPGGALDLLSSVSIVVADIAIDPAGRACIVGSDGSNLVVAIVAADGRSVDYTTGIPGPGAATASSIAAAPDGDLIVTGQTDSSTFATPGAYDVTRSGLPTPFTPTEFVARLAPFTAVPRWVSYFEANDARFVLSSAPLRAAVTVRGEPILIGATSGHVLESVPAGTSSSQGFILRSANGGRSFAATVSPLPFAPGQIAPWRDMSFSFDVGNPAVLHAAYEGGSFTSRDHGATWQPLVDIFRVVLAHPSRPGVLYASDRFNVHTSTDGGATWQYRGPVTPLAPRIGAFAVDPSASDTLYAGADGGMYRSVDGARSWLRVGTGLPDGEIRRIAPVLGSPGRLYAIASGAVYASVDAGASWAPSSNGLLSDANALVVAPSASATLYAIASAAVFRSTDGGRSWEMVSLPRPGGPLALTVDPTDARVVYVATLDTIYRSTDGGRTLVPARGMDGSNNQLYAPLVAVHPSNPDLVFAFSMRTRPDAFAAVMSADGTRLLASKAFGGLFPDGALAVATRNGDEIWIAGQSWSGDFPRAREAQPSLRGGRDTFVARFDAHADADGDTLPTSWELQFGLNPDSDAADDGESGDPDLDGRTNAQEYMAGTHPRGLFTRYFAEGATSGFFDTHLALLPTLATSADLLVRFQTRDGATPSYPLNVSGLTRASLDIKEIPGLATAEFSTVIESDQPFVADRTMSWDVGVYGSHAETSVAALSTTWYLAEGATHSGFELFYLLQNPNDGDAVVEVRYLLPSGGPLVRAYTVAARSRFTVWVNMVDATLASTDVSAIVSADRPVIVERAMYLSTPDHVFEAGHASAGTTSLSSEWFFAEGATGPFFDTFVLVANPTGGDAPIRATYLLPDGTEIVKTHLVPAGSRYTIWVDLEDPRLADTAVSTIITSTANVPIVAERSMWWPGPTAATWAEAHNSAGVTSTGSTWALAEGEVGGPRNAETYILIANRGAADSARVTIHYEDGTNESRIIVLPATSRTNVAVAMDFPNAVDRRFGAIVEALGTDSQIVVERALYSSPNGVIWAAGTNAVATKLR